MSVYAAMITRMDKNIGKLVRKIKDLGELDNTLILFLSDNGASPETVTRAYRDYQPTGDEVPGSVTTYWGLGPNWGRVANTPLKGHKATSYEGGICTPMIAHWPRVIRDRNSIRRDLCHLVDIVPTILSVTGSPYPETFEGKPIQTPVDGLDISMTFEGKPLPKERYLFFSYGGDAVLNASWKALGSGENWHLYHFAEDRSESEDVRDEHPEILQRMRDEWAEYYEKHK
jgi:arylsulfatase